MCELNQWSSASPWGYPGLSRLEVRCYCHLVGGGQRCTRHPTMHGKGLCKRQRMLHPKFKQCAGCKPVLGQFLPHSRSCSVAKSNSLWPHGLQHTSLPCPSPSPEIGLNSCALSQWCHRTISSSVVPFTSRLQSFPASGSFPMSQFFASGGQSIGVSASASVLPMNIQDCFPLGRTSLISLQSKGLSRVFSSTTVWKHQFFDSQPALLSNSHIHSWLLKKP